MPALGLEVPKKDIDELFSLWDADGCGKLDFRELRRLLKPRTDTHGQQLRAAPREKKDVVAKGKSTKQIQDEAAHKVDTHGGSLSMPPREKKDVVAKGKSTKQIQDEAEHKVDTQGGSLVRPQAKRPDVAGPSKPINATHKVDTKGPAGGKREPRSYSTLQAPDSRRSVRRTHRPHARAPPASPDSSAAHTHVLLTPPRATP